MCLNLCALRRDVEAHSCMSAWHDRHARARAHARAYAHAHAPAHAHAHAHAPASASAHAHAHAHAHAYGDVMLSRCCAALQCAQIYSGARPNAIYSEGREWGRHKWITQKCRPHLCRPHLCSSNILWHLCVPLRRQAGASFGAQHITRKKSHK